MVLLPAVEAFAGCYWKFIKSLHYAVSSTTRGLEPTSTSEFRYLLQGLSRDWKVIRAVLIR